MKNVQENINTDFECNTLKSNNFETNSNESLNLRTNTDIKDSHRHNNL